MFYCCFGQAAASMFEQACNERIQQFDDNDSDEDIWEEKEITFSPNAQQQNRAAYVKAYQFMRHNNSQVFINTFELWFGNAYVLDYPLSHLYFYIPVGYQKQEMRVIVLTVRRS